MDLAITKITQNPKFLTTYQRLIDHPLYSMIHTTRDLEIFMSHHVYVVWDFMSLAKSLQRKLTCVEKIWNPVANPEIARFINEIILAEESDELPNGQIMSHFELYLAAMEQLQINTTTIKCHTTHLKFNKFPQAVKNFVSQNIKIASEGPTLQVLCYFLFGREKIIPEMFQEILKNLSEQQCSLFRLYLNRHIELDGDHHGPMLEKCLTHFIKTPKELSYALNQAISAMELRIRLWDDIAELVKQNYQGQINNFQEHSWQ